MQSANSASSIEDMRAIIDDHLQLEGPLLPILHALQEAYGYIPDESVGQMADALNLTKAEVHGVVSFYHDFRKTPAGRHVVKICRAEACQSMGGNALAADTLAKLGIDWNGTTPNGAVTVEPVFCLGMCACAPAAMVDDRVHERMNGARMDKLLAEVGA